MLERQIMFKQLPELQREKKLQELKLNDSRQQNVMESLMHNKQSSGALYRLMNTGIRVRDPSQMFIFGDSSVMPGDGSARFPTPNSTAQASRNMLELPHKVDKEYTHGTQSGYTGSAPITKVPKGEPDNELTPTYNSSSRLPYFGLRFAPPSQGPVVNIDSSWISQQAGHPDKPFQGLQSDYNQPQIHNYRTRQSPMLSVKNEDGQQLSTLEAKQHLTTSGMTEQVASPTTPPNVWVDVPVQQNLSGIGSFVPPRLPSTSHATNSRMETAFKASKGLDCCKHVIEGNTSIETDAHAINSQGLEDTEAKCGNHTLPISAADTDAFGHTLKQTDAASRSHYLRKPLNCDPNTMTEIKNERVSYDSRVPQTTSLSQLKSAFGNHTSHPISSQPHLQAVSPDIITHKKASSWLKNREASKTKQMLSMNDARIGTNMARIMAGGSHRSLERSSSLVHVATNDQCKSSGPITVTNDVPLTSSYSICSQHLDMANQNKVVLKSKKRKSPNQNKVVLKSKKRKFPTFEHPQWHKEVTGGCSRFHDMSTAELDWTRSANRLPEKLEDTKVHWKRRLILTTQLMQLVFLPVPASILSEDATAHCDTAAYYAAKLALDDACSLASRSYRHHDISGLPSGKCMTSKSNIDQDLSKTVEVFIDRSKSLEEELSRLEKGDSSIVDVKVEFQDLEKFSVINRFAVFHSRGSSDTASSHGASAMPKLYPERYVKTRVMPSTVPEGHHCLSL